MQLLSKPITRRYTPPTCTLEVTGETSALSQWTSRPVLKNVQFQLSLDDPRQPREQPLQLRGDREQLEALTETVETYVQTLVNASPTEVSLGLPLGEQPVTEEMGRPPQSLLTHSLPLTAIGDEATTVTLSATQLFDLATALEEYSAEAAALPVPSSGKPLAWLGETPIWARSAAIALMAVGVSLAILELANQNSPSQLARQEAASPQPEPLPVPSPPPTNLLPQIPPLSTAPVVPFPSPPAIPSPPTQVPNIATAPNLAAPPAPSGAAPEAAPESLAIQPRPAQGSAASAPQAPELPPPAADAPFSIAAQDSPEAASRSAARPQTEQLADTVPQVAEARSYFQERWQPPESLKQTLEYTLILNPDGSLQRAVPLGEAAATYLDRTPIPLSNEPFVAPLGGQGSALIRLVLYPDGEVQTFLQPAN